MMAPRLSWVLTALSLLFASGVTAEFVTPDPPAPEVAPPPAEPKPLSAIKVFDPAQATATVLARPLFTPGRQAPGAAVASPDRGPPVLPRLSGTILTGRNRFAVFEPGEHQRPVVTPLGSAVDGWTVQSIDESGIVVVRPGAVRVVLVQFDPNAAPLASAAPVGLLATKKTDPHLQP